MAVPVLHVCDKFGVRGSSIHGVSRLFSWWFPRYDPSRFTVSLCGLKAPEPATERLAEQGIVVHHLGRAKFDPRILTDLIALVRRMEARILHVHGYAAADFGRLAARATGAALVLHEHLAKTPPPPDCVDTGVFVEIVPDPTLVIRKKAVQDYRELLSKAVDDISRLKRLFSLRRRTQRRRPGPEVSRCR